ncbi:MAG: hypothetical protein AB7V39_00400 [Nitrospiraceae bacterium]
MAVDTYPKWKLALSFVILGLIFLLLPVILTVVGFLGGLVLQYALIKIAFVEAMRRKNAQDVETKKGDAK